MKLTYKCINLTINKYEEFRVNKNLEAHIVLNEKNSYNVKRSFYKLKVLSVRYTRKYKKT